MKYVGLYPWRVLEAIAEGKKVYVLDRQLKVVRLVNAASCQDVVRAIENAEKEKGRYEYWYEEACEEAPEYEVDDGEL